MGHFYKSFLKFLLLDLSMVLFHLKAGKKLHQFVLFSP